jgi:translation initiation factor IF-2
MYEQNVIYHLFDDLRGELGRLLPSNVEQVQSGMAEVKQVFALDKGSQKESFVAGCIITHGKLSYKGTYELYRYKQKLWSGSMSYHHHLFTSFSTLFGTPLILTWCIV